MDEKTRARIEALENRVRILEGQMATCMRGLKYIEAEEKKQETDDEIKALENAVYTLEAKVITVQGSILDVVEPKAAAVNPMRTRKENPSA